MIVVEVKPLQEPFPEGTQFIHFTDCDKILAVSPKELDALMAMLGGDMSGCSIKLSPMPNGNILIQADMQ